MFTRLDSILHYAATFLHAVFLGQENGRLHALPLLSYYASLYHYALRTTVLDILFHMTNNSVPLWYVIYNGSDYAFTSQAYLILLGTYCFSTMVGSSFTAHLVITISRPFITRFIMGYPCRDYGIYWVQQRRELHGA